MHVGTLHNGLLLGGIANPLPEVARALTLRMTIAGPRPGAVGNAIAMYCGMLVPTIQSNGFLGPLLWQNSNGARGSPLFWSSLGVQSRATFLPVSPL